MAARLRRMFWKVVPHRHRMRFLSTRYGCSATCVRCGASQSFMDLYPWGD